MIVEYQFFFRGLWFKSSKGQINSNHVFHGCFLQLPLALFSSESLGCGVYGK